MASGILPRGVATFELALFDPAFCATTGYWGFVDATFSKDSLHEKDFEERGRELCSAVVKITDELLGIFEESVLLREGSVPGSLEGVLEQFKEHFTRIGEKLERAQQSEIDSGSDSHAQAEQLVGGREDADGTDDQIRLPVKSSDTPLHGWAYRDAGRKRPPIGTRAHGTEPGDIPLFKHFTKSSRMSISTLQRMERIVPHWIRKFSSYVAWRRHEVSRMHDHEVSEMVANSEMLLLCPLGEEASHQLSRLDAYGALGNESAEEAATLFGPCACDIDRHSHTGALCGEFHTHAKGIHLQYDVNKRNLFWTRVDGTRRTHGTPCSLLGMKVLRRDLEVVKLLGSLLLAWNMADERSTGTSKREETRDAGSDISMAETDEDYDQFLLGLMDDISCNEAAIQPEKHRSVTKRPPTPGKQSVGTVEEHVDNEDVFSQWVSVPSSRKRSRSKRGPKEEEEEEEEGKGDSEEDEEAIGARGTGGGLRSTRQHTGPGTGVAQNRIGDISFNAGSGLRSEDRRTVQQLSVFTQTLSNALQLPVSELFATDEMDSEIMKFWDDDVAELRETQEEREETGSHEHVGREDGGEDPEYTILDQLAHRAQSRRDHDSGDGDRGREDARMARRSLGGASGGRTRTMYLQSGIRGAMEEAIVMLKSFIPQKYTSMQLASHKKRSVVVLYGKIVAKFIIKARQGNTTSRLDLLQEKRLRLDIKMLAEAIKQELK